MGRVLTSGNAPNEIEMCKEVKMLELKYINKDINLTLCCLFYVSAAWAEMWYQPFLKWRNHWMEGETR